MKRARKLCPILAALGVVCLGWATTGQAAYLTSDGDFGNQQDNVNTVSPWNKVAGYVGVGLASAQSPFTNIFAANGMGAGWINATGATFFIQTFTSIPTNATGTLYLNLDWKVSAGSGTCGLQLGSSGGAGAVAILVSSSALYAGGSGGYGASILTPVPGVWYNVQLVVDLAAHTYSGAVINADNSLRTPISSRAYTNIALGSLFLYANAGGMCSVDNWVLSDTPLPAPPSVDVVIRYVAQAGQTPSGNYLTWATAASNIQDAVDAASSGETVLVSNGVYNAGGVKTPSYSVTNRIMVNKAVSVRSVNGPAATIIEGAADTNDAVNGLGSNAVRCVYLGSGASLSGFILRNGRTYKTGGNDYGDQSGGGILLRTNCLVSNCVITANRSKSYAGGALLWGSALMTDCILTNNYAAQYGGGAQTDAGVISNCTIVGNSSGLYGGGVVCGFYSGGVLSHSVVSRNVSDYGPGGVQLHANTSIDNCLVVANTGRYAHATAGGPGGVQYAANGTMNNCTVANNNGKIRGGGVGFTLSGSSNVMNNCIVWGNTGGSDGYTNIFVSNATVTVINNTCSRPAQTAYGANNIDADPLFANTNIGNYRLAANSPCVNAGTNGSWMTGTAVDLDGHRRILYGTVDMGAYEFLRTGTILGFR